jgi:site-specific recombinase XerD
MAAEQKSLFDRRAYRGTRPPAFRITPSAADQTVNATLPAYHAYLSSGKYSQYTPDDFTADVRRFGQFTASRCLRDVQTADVQQWVSQLKQTMPPKTVSRKVSAVRNYFRWLQAERVLRESQAERVHPQRVTSPLPSVLFEGECERLLTTASSDARIYLLIMLVLETGLKKAELLGLRVGDFYFSDKYQPQLYVRHTGRQVFKDRRLKLPTQINSAFDDYVRQDEVTDLLFPRTPRLITQVLNEAVLLVVITMSVCV